MVGVPEEFIANIWHRINIYRANRITEQIRLHILVGLWYDTFCEAVSARFGGPYNRQLLLFSTSVLTLFSINFYPYLIWESFVANSEGETIHTDQFQRMYSKGLEQFWEGFSKIFFNAGKTGFHTGDGKWKPTISFLSIDPMYPVRDNFFKRCKDGYTDKFLKIRNDEE